MLTALDKTTVKAAIMNIQGNEAGLGGSNQQRTVKYLLEDKLRIQGERQHRHGCLQQCIITWKRYCLRGDTSTVRHMIEHLGVESSAEQSTKSPHQWHPGDSTSSQAVQAQTAACYLTTGVAQKAYVAASSNINGALARAGVRRVTP